MAYQFARIELYSRKGKEGRGTDYIFDEVARRPEASLHVSKPLSPTVVFGESIDRLRAIHDESAASARTTVNGKLKAIRKDQNTLATIIISHPITVDECKGDQALQADVSFWQRRSVAWLKSRYGDELISIVLHMDESHPHLHAYLIPSDDQMRAAKLHPGHAAKNGVKTAGPAPGEDEKTLRKRADRAYVQAMRDWLDDFHLEVATPCGLTRLGPGKRRLTRAGWQKEKAQAQALKTTLEQAHRVREKGQEYIARVKMEAATVTAAAERKMADANQATKVAQEAQRRALSVEDAAQVTLLRASRYTGWAGWMRGLWDNLRKSQLVSKIHNDVRQEVALWRTLANEAEHRRIEADRQRRDAENKLREARSETLRVVIERDRAQSILSHFEYQAGSSEKHLAPNLAQKNRSSADIPGLVSKRT
ncbi:plasmid recombination protein [Rhizobium brockwellii]|uniref:plasmid recombination protein n=1 Tax=Rhizobium brockwellii TaxID=3019932 RepID=UPI003F98AA26